MGRPRSEQVHRAILGAALELLATDGYGRVTMEGVAERAGVSKQTIYRWWRSPAEVLMEALNERAAELVAGRDLGSLERNLRGFLRRTVAALHGGLAPLVGGLMAESQRDPQFAGVFREQFLARRRAALRELLEQGVERGEVAAGVDLELLVDVAFGTVWYRLLSGHAPLSRRFADRLADALLALAAGS
ncbi:MAG TPA: TetR/AcrR family transcriptional regulator [Solirubrobacteraceae bacterium]|jgi:AcrR family transcriptional regulator|nr:TetR/AcrR family transcriptional regulator [Solirubrobacteraceae bacterium]